LLPHVKNCFVFRKWDGICGLPPIKLEWDPGMPTSHRGYTPKISEQLRPYVLNQWQKQSNFVYEQMYSPWASPLVIAPKPAPDMVRLCGDYTWTKKWLRMIHWSYPDPKDSLDRLKGMRFFDEIDFWHSFHQWRLAPEDQQKLAVLTPWGTFGPKFLPMGVAPASALEQSGYERIFQDCKDFLLIIHDNVLSMARSVEELHANRIRIFEAASRHNVKFRMNKCKWCVTEVNWFGYVISKGAVSLDQSRLDGIDKIPLPKCRKDLQSFLGCTNFCSAFIPCYSEVRAPLDDLTRADVDWIDRSKWTIDYPAVFAAFKEAMKQSMRNHHPDRNMPWVSTHDASCRAVSSALVQLKKDESGLLRPCLIALTHKKLSGPATRWPVIKQECYAIVHAHIEWERLLMGKSHTIESDHANFQWLELSNDICCMRWLTYLQQQCSFVIVHRAGTRPTTAAGCSTT
jgi:hypothetical protein